MLKGMVLITFSRLWGSSRSYLFLVGTCLTSLNKKITSKTCFPSTLFQRKAPAMKIPVAFPIPCVFLQNPTVSLVERMWHLDWVASISMLLFHKRNLIIHHHPSSIWKISSSIIITIINDFPQCLNVHLVGGFNPSEKYYSQIWSFPQVRVKIKNIWNHHLVIIHHLVCVRTPTPEKKVPQT